MLDLLHECLDAWSIEYSVYWILGPWNVWSIVDSRFTSSWSIIYLKKFGFFSYIVQSSHTHECFVNIQSIHTIHQMGYGKMYLDKCVVFISFFKIWCRFFALSLLSFGPLIHIVEIEPSTKHTHRWMGDR